MNINNDLIEITDRSTIRFENIKSKKQFYKCIRWNIDYLVELSMNESGIYPPHFKIEIEVYDEDYRVFDEYTKETGRNLTTPYPLFVSKKDRKIHLSTNGLNSKKLIHEIVHVLCEKAFSGSMSLKTQHIICWKVESEM